MYRVETIFRMRMTNDFKDLAEGLATSIVLTNLQIRVRKFVKMANLEN